MYLMHIIFFPLFVGPTLFLTFEIHILSTLHHSLKACTIRFNIFINMQVIAIYVKFPDLYFNENVHAFHTGYTWDSKQLGIYTEMSATVVQ